MSQWDDLIQQSAQKYNVDPKLIASVIHVESSGNPNAYRSDTGATGLTQIIPSTAKALGVDPRTPAGAIEGAAKLLDENLRRYGNPEQAILAYHGGTDQANWGPKTQDYLRKVSTQYGAPQVAKLSSDDFASQDFAAATVQKADAGDNFAAMDFAAPAPKAVPDQVIGQQQPQGGQAMTVGAQQPQAVSAPAVAPGYGDMAMQGLAKLGEIGIGNARAAGRGISDAFDAPSEWLASGAEKIGLTGALAKAGINMPTAEQQKQINADSRAQYDASTTGGFQQGMSRLLGNIAGVAVPVAGAEAAIATGGRALAEAAGNPALLAKVGNFAAGNGGVVSKAAYGAAQGAAGGALLSGGQPGTDPMDSIGLGAVLGGSVPIAGAAIRYGAGTAKALAAPFTDAGRAGIAQKSLQGEAIKDPLNNAQIAVPAAPIPSASATPAENAAVAAAHRVSAEDAVNRAAAGGRIAANFNEIVPGSQPTLAQATGNAGLAALERAAMSRSPNAFAERQLANYSARNAFMDQIKGTPETLEAAIAKRDSEALPFLRSALDGARPANANPVMAEIESIVAGRSGQRDEVVKALEKVKGKLDLGEGKGLQSDVEQLYGIRQSINDQLTTVAGRDNSASQLASKELIQVRDKLDDSIQKAAPGFKEFLTTYSSLSKPVDAQRYLQGLDLTDQTSNRITLNKVKSAITKIDKMRKAPGANEAKSIADDQMNMLKDLQSDLQREAHSSRGMALGSNTFQNFATNQLIDQMMPGLAGKLAPVTPSGLGGALGYAIAGPAGAGIGAIGAQQAAGIAGRALNAQGPEIEARLIDYLLNARGAAVLKPAASPTPALDALVRRSSVAAPAATPTGNGNRN